jgi:hypothetical protein
MADSDHIHRFSFYAWTFYIFLSGFVLLLVYGVLSVKAQDLLSGNLMFAEYIIIAFIVLLLIPIGLLTFIYPFVTKIIVKTQGLEYHGLTYVLSVDWKDLVNIGYVKDTYVGKTLVVIPQGGKLQIRNWAMPLQEILVKHPQELQILVSQFGTSDGHSFENDVLVNVARQSEADDESELV